MWILHFAVFSLFLVILSLSTCCTFQNVVAFEVTRRDISRTRASGGVARNSRHFVRFADPLSGARQIDLEMKRLSSIWFTPPPAYRTFIIYASTDRELSNRSVKNASDLSERREYIGVLVAIYILLPQECNDCNLVDFFSSYSLCHVAIMFILWIDIISCEVHFYIQIILRKCDLIETH